MDIARAPALWNVLHRQPGLVGVAADNLAGRLRHRLTGRVNGGAGWSAPPEQITVVVTDICNLRCKMCQYAFSEAPGYQLNRIGRMDPRVFRKLIEEIPGRPMVTFTGGEPLLHPQVAEMIACATQRGRFSTLTTNGWMLEKRASELAAAGLGLLIVSVDGPQEVHNRIRGGKSFERLAAGLQAMLRLPHRPAVFISMAITDLNCGRLPDMYSLALEWGVDGLNFNHLWMQTHGMVEAYNSRFSSIFQADEVAWDIHPERVDTGAVAGALESIRQRNRWGRLLVIETPHLDRSSIDTWYHRPEEFVKYNSTRCAWTRMKVWPDGAVKPCREWQAGNVAHAHAMAVWNGEKFRQFRQLLTEQGTLPICARCCYMAHR